MGPTQRKVAVVTSLGKKYSGLIDIPSDTFRTTDIFNSSHIYWKNPDLKCYDDAILMRDARLFLEEKSVYQKFDMIQIKLSEIIYFYDDIEQLGNEIEKKRMSALHGAKSEESQTIHIITTQVANSFYDITGIFSGRFRKKSKDAFIPLTETRIIEVLKKEDKWFQKKVALPHNFICIGSKYIESLTLR